MSEVSREREIYAELARRLNREAQRERSLELQRRSIEPPRDDEEPEE